MQLGLGEGHDTVGCIVTGSGLLAGSCVAIHQMYRDRKASLAWVKAVSRYKFCIVTEGGLKG